MHSILVLGGGMVGSVIAADLAASANVTIADLRDESLERSKQMAARFGRSIQTTKIDLRDTRAVDAAVKPFDLVCGAVASGIAYKVMETVIEAGKNYADISFMPEDADAADGLAKKHGVQVVTDFGVAPGMSHVLAARAAAMLDRCDALEIYVGGLPRARAWPFQYKAAFSPADVIEEYTRPTRLVEHHRVVTREALSEPELIDFPAVGSLEAFNTDGLRSLARSYLGRVPNMKEKTLRYPGHIELMRALRHTGLMSETPIDLRGTRVVPRELLATLMFPHWTYKPGEEDLTIMRIIAAGEKAGRASRVQWDLFDTLDPKTLATSMARTTAFPCAAAARMLLDGTLRPLGPGVLNPERLGEHPAVVERLLREHQARGVNYTMSQS